MLGQTALARAGEIESVHVLAQTLRAWEPEVELVDIPRHARLYEPDGTLYAVALTDGLRVSFGNQERSLGLGDLIVVPQAVALDVEPITDLFGVRYNGPAPDHFRERFIQVWGYEHLPAPPLPIATGRCGAQEVLGRGDVRHRLPYLIVDAGDKAIDAESTLLDVHLLVGISGEAEVELLEQARAHVLRERDVLTIGPQLRYVVRGRGRVGILIVLTELAHQARRLEVDEKKGVRLSPEYHAPRGDDNSARSKSAS